MAFTFPSEEWIARLKVEINASEEYRQSAAEWEAGDVCYVVNPNPALGLNEAYCIRLDLLRGECREAQHVGLDEGLTAKFQIFADYDRWKQLIQGKLDPIAALMMGKIKAKGDLPTIIKHTRAAKDLVACTTKIDTKFLDEP